MLVLLIVLLYWIIYNIPGIYNRTILNIKVYIVLEHVDPSYSSPLLDNLQYPRHIQPNHPKYQGIYIVLEHPSYSYIGTYTEIFSFQGGLSTRWKTEKPLEIIDFINPGGFWPHIALYPCHMLEKIGPPCSPWLSPPIH